MAGTTVACACGENVEVPSLARLKASVGESAVSADFELEQRAAAGDLPPETACVMCGRHTDHTIRTTIECDKRRTDGGQPKWWEIVIAWFLNFWILVFLITSRRLRESEHGQDVIFTVPIRACESCAVGVTTPAAVRNLLLRTPLYARVLEKYPRARVSLPHGS
jgi:hypothetical protein